MKVILAEKPSVARDIARIVGATQRKNGWLEGRGYQVTWAFGHLVNIAEPAVMCKDWGGQWNFAQLPMIPSSFQLTVNPNSSNQFDIISQLFKGCEEIINATDAGREGELIFRWIYRHSGCQKKFRRLWISDLTDESIRKGLSTLHEGHDFDHLGESAQCRAFADWMVGLNATRAYSIRNNQLYTVGRVQTPTLALIVNRQELINGFKKIYYYELYARTRNIAFRWEDKNGYKLERKEKAEKLKATLDGKPGEIVDIKKLKKSTKPPPLYDLTLLQKECHEKFLYTAKETLDFAQVLYERDKLITYPRTESRHLSEKMRPELPRILRNAPDELKPFAQKSLQRLESGHTPGKNYLDDKKLTDHHAIIPTNKKCQGHLDTNIKNVYFLIQKRFISIFHPDFVEDVTVITMNIDKECFKFKGAIPVEPGWKSIYIYQNTFQKKEQNLDKPLENGEKQDDGLAQNPIRQEMLHMINAKFEKGQTTTIDSLEIKEKETLPPKPFTDGTLLNAMRYVGRQVDDESLSAQLKDQGLGTQSTRAAIIERLIKSKYIFRKGKNLIPTEKGVHLINMVVTDLKSPEMTAQWEKKFSEIQDGTLKDSVFMREIQSFTEKIIPVIKESRPCNGLYSQKESFGICPKCRKGQIYEGKKAYYCSRYKEGCQFVLWRTMASKEITPTQVKKILKDGRSALIKGFKSKTGRTFQAMIELDSEYKTKFCFDT